MRYVSVFPVALFCVLPCFSQTSIAPAPADGQSTITIIFTNPLAAPGTGALYSNPSAAAGDPCVAVPDYVVPLKAGVPTLASAGSKTLVLVSDQTLTEGTPLCAIVTVAGGNNTATYVLVGAPSSPPGYDWGHVRAYFFAGGMTSQEHDQFSHEDLFLAFRLDKTYFMYKDNRDNSFRPSLSTFYEARLTALPVAVQSCTTSTSSSCSSSTSSSTSGSGATPSTTTQTFLNSQKSARLHFGVYFPVYFPSWSVTSKSGKTTTTTNYALYIAPIVKTGFDTTLNGLNQTQQKSSTASQVQPIGISSEFYKFYDFGFRLGHDQLSSQKGVAPTQISYLDVGWGRYSNLASLLCPASEYQGTNTCNVPSGTLPWHRDIRLRVEGSLEIPATKGFSVGFSTNVSFHPGNQSNTASTIHIQPADDLRFLFGYKFDISKIAAKLAPQNF